MQQGIEPLEARIAPATVTTLPTIRDAELAYDANPLTDTHFVTTKVGTPILLKAGQVLTTGVKARDGVYLMFVEKGSAMIFTTDFNNNNQVDFNEITGIAAGDGLRLVSFVDINGDIVTNLDSDGTLSDSNNNAVGDDPFLRGDGKVLNNSRIEKIELRSLLPADITDQDPGNDTIDGGNVDNSDVFQRLAFSSYSIHGNVFAGGGVGLASDPTSGIIIDTTGKTLQSVYNGVGNSNYFLDFLPSIGAIKVGTAATGEYFSFSISKANDIQGNLRPFVPTAGQAGASINYVHAIDPVNMTFSLSQLVAGDGGLGAPGGSITNVTLHGDINGGYFIKAGDGGRGPNGGNGGSIINFSDIGTVTSQVVLQSGSGGTGTTGVGGSGGVVVLAGQVTTTVNGVTTTTTPFNVNGGVAFVLGSGGDGFRAGGAGASLGKGVITAPDTPASFGRNIIGASHDGPHDPLTGKLIAGGSIGRQHMVDFDQDGLGDFVFSTTDSDQLIVQFGDGTGGFRLLPDGRPDRIYLDGPLSAEAITVADFNGDGHQDIAAASQAPGAFGGIFVYLSKWEDANVNGLTSDEDVNHNGIDEFQGFSLPRQSPLPTLQAGDPSGGPIFNLNFAYLNSGHAINDIEAGDFDGDGFTDIAISVTYISKPPVASPYQLVIFMSPDIEDGRPTGEFFADFGNKEVAQPPQGANPYLPFYLVEHSAQGQIEATSLSINATHDVILAMPQANTLAIGNLGSSTQINGFFVLDNSVPNILGPTLVNIITTTGVDTDRLLPQGGNPHINFQRVFLKEIQVVDFNQDGKADFVALSETPTSFIIGWTGDGLGGAQEFTINHTLLPGNIVVKSQQNSGIFLGPPPGGAYNLGSIFVGIRPVDGDADGNLDEIGVLSYHGLPIWNVDIIDFILLPTSTLQDQPGGDYLGLGGQSGFIAAPDNSVVAFDTFVPSAGSPSVINFLVSIPHTAVDRPALHSIESSGPFNIFPQLTPLSERFFHFTAGDGGDSLIGRGGPGGSIGSGLITSSLTGAIGQNAVATSELQVTMPVNLEFAGDVLFQAGFGGDGFTRGGAGGNIQSLVLRFPGQIFHSDVTVLAGDGGLGVSSVGGKGGSIIGGSLENSIAYTAGNGGAGRIGGAGGDILGNGLENIYDSRSLYFIGTAGFGGNGVRRGGDGGAVLNFKSQFDIVLQGGVGGQYILTGGNGGTAVSGPGGRGGSVTGVSPLDQDNLFGGDILLQGGNGGNGTTGGTGGSISGFNNGPDSDELPKVLSVIAGNGGNGTSGPGGNGGSVSNIIAPMKGVFHSDDILGPPATVYGFNRILGGIGGSSAASAGGNGGNISNINSKSEGGPYAVTAGAGGPGLIRGGDGGNVANILIDVGATSVAKLLVVAGNGGDAGAFIANSGDPSFQNQAFKAFGGRVGRGGNGGNITGIFQSGGIQSRADLVAGNGGDTVFYGTVADSLSFVGRGGSVRNVTADGTLGNILDSIAILSYFNYRNGETMTDFIAKNLRDELSPGSILDSVGNVGVVVGAAGRLKRVYAGNDPAHAANFVSTPAPHSVNGDLSDVHARGILAAVAGNVDRIASITNVRNVSVIPGFEVGVDKIVGDPINYLDKFGNPSPLPVIDGTLVDGAIISARQPVNSAGKAVNLPGNAFVLS
jgi:hypothetical protein